MYTNVYMHRHIYVYICIYIQIYMYAYAYIYIYMCMYTSTYIFLYIYTYIFEHITKKSYCQTLIKCQLCVCARVCLCVRVRVRVCTFLSVTQGLWSNFHTLLSCCHMLIKSQLRSNFLKQIEQQADIGIPATVATRATLPAEILQTHFWVISSSTLSSELTIENFHQ